MARGIKDKVAILGMGCSNFGERWDSGAEELMLEAYKECIPDAGIDAKRVVTIDELVFDARAAVERDRPALAWIERHRALENVRRHERQTGAAFQK